MMELSITDLSDIYSLFLYGFAIGGLLSGLPFVLGYAIQALIRFFKS